MANGTEDARGVPLGIRELPALIPFRQVEDAQTIKALANPLRLRIMRVLSEGAREEARIMSVKQIAAELGETPNKLYRHIRQLLAVDLIQVAEVRLVGRIVEQRFRTAQILFGLDPETLGDLPAAPRDIMKVGSAAIDEFTGRFRAAVNTGRTRLPGATAEPGPAGARTITVITDNRIPRARAAEFGERLTRLTEEFLTFDRDEDGVSANLLTVFYVAE